MNNDLISRDALINAKPEFRNEKVVRDTKYQTTKDRIYAKAWNACNSYWLNTIKNASPVEEQQTEETKEDMRLIDADKLKKSLNYIYDCAYIESKSKEGIASDIIDEIDQAPTVSFMISPDYVTELQNHNKELIKQLEEVVRPQGKWIITREEQGAFGIIYKRRKCNQCGWENSLLIPRNFCPKCGADMRGDTE